MGSIVLYESSIRHAALGYHPLYVRINFSESYNSSTNSSTVTLTSIEMKTDLNVGSVPVHGTVEFSANGSSYTTVKSMSGGSNQVNLNTSYNNVTYSSGSSITIPHNTSGAATLYVRCASGFGVQYSGSRFGFTSNEVESTALTTHVPTYTIAYNSNGYGTAPANQTKTHGTNITLRSFIQSGSVIQSPANYTITGNANGGTWSGNNGSATRTPTVSFTQTYWNTNSNGSGTNYGSGDTYSTDANLTLYAIWDSNTTYTYTYTLPTGTPTKPSTSTSSITVSYNANGGNSTPSSQTSVKSIVYDFSGWYTAESGGTKRTTSSQVSSSETVYAHYDSTTGTQSPIILASAITKNNSTESGYKVTFNANGGTSTKTSETATRTIFWDFNGWAKDSVNGALFTPGTLFTPTENTTFYGVWGRGTNEGTITLPTTAQCTKTNAVLLGWSTNSTAALPTYNPGDSYTPSENITLYAVWGNTNGLLPKEYIPYIYNGSSWIEYIPYLYNGSSWSEQSEYIF